MTTQNCAECGTRAEPGQSFCDSCGAVLSWDQAGSRTGPTRTSGATPAAGSAPPGGATPPAGSATSAASAPSGGSASEGPAGPGWDAFGRPGGTGVARPPRPLHGTGHHTGATTATTAPGDPGPSAATPDASRLPRHQTGTWDSGQGGGNDGWATAASSGEPYPGERDPTVPLPTDDSASDRARSLLVPIAEPEPSHSSPPPTAAPVLPGRPDTDRPQVRVPGPLQDTGNGPPCSWCSTPNRPDRHFCARCAMPLAENDDRASAPRPWWRRLTGRGSQETPWAGDRPRIRRAFDRIGTWITAAIVITLLIVGAMYLPDGIQATRDHFAKRAQVAPTAFKASRSYTGHKPQLAFDKVDNSWWGPGVSQSGEGEWIEASFDQPTRLLDVIITPGVSTKADQLNESALPHRLKATITAKDGNKTTRQITLDQGLGAQRRAFRVGEASKVRFTIESAHSASSDKQVAIAEIEFFGPASSDGS